MSKGVEMEMDKCGRRGNNGVNGYWGKGLEAVREEIGLGWMEPYHEVPKALGSNSRLLSKKKIT